MAKHDHKVCTHENVKYCAKCAVCHCLECDKEWGGTTYQYYPYYPYTIYNIGGIGGSYTPSKQPELSKIWCANDNQTQAQSELQAQTCSHGL